MSKRDLFLSKPLMNAAGSLGLSPDERKLAPWDAFGAFVTNPLSFRPRKPAVQPATVDFPGGFLLHSGLPNPGLEAALKKHAARWQRSRLPIIVHLIADRPEQTSVMVRRLESLEGIVAAELGFAPQLADDIILIAVEASLGEMPLIACLPFDQVLRIGPRLVGMGVAAISLAPPRGLMPRQPASAALESFIMEIDEEKSRTQLDWVAGRLFGPALFAQSLLVVRSAVRAGMPIIGGCGVYSPADARTMQAAGAFAVQVETTLWRGDFSPG